MGLADLREEIGRVGEIRGVMIATPDEDQQERQDTMGKCIGCFGFAVQKRIQSKPRYPQLDVSCPCMHARVIRIEEAIYQIMKSLGEYMAMVGKTS